MRAPIVQLLAVLLLALSAGSASAAAKASPLVDAGWLAANRDAVVVLDIQDAKDYQRFHVPGAVNAPYDQWRTKGSKTALGSMLPDADRLADMIGGLGIGNGDHVIIVATGRGAGDLAAAARVFWTFKVLGHDAVSVLDGGLVAFADSGARLAAGNDTRPSTTFEPRLRPELMPTADEVRAAVAAGVATVDARSEGEFVGLYTGDSRERPGTIPGARHLPYDWVADDATGKLRTTGALAALFSARGIATDGDQIHFCHSGNRAALTWFTAYAVLGNEQARLYDGSMMEWARREDLPVDAQITLCKAC
jgi:thiosulfate/3-mercaptopyruvate sulfurtransferase